MAGLKIGKNTYIGTSNVDIMDPCLLEIGKDTYIGSFTVIGSHVLDADKIIMKKVTIGNNCLIGGMCLIFPGAVIGDNVTLGAKSLVLKNQVLEKNSVYAGVPAKKIK